MEFRAEGAVYHVHRPSGSHKTYLDVFVGYPFSGNLPDDIDSITVTGPNGDLPIDKSDFNYNPKTRVFWTVLPGFPQIGKYTFKLVNGTYLGSATDTRSIVKSIPISIVSKFKPVRLELINGQNWRSALKQEQEVRCGRVGVSWRHHSFYTLS